MENIELKSRLDDIDRKILELFENRMELMQEVAKYKQSHNAPVFDELEEKSRLNRVKAEVHDVKNQEMAEELFTQLISLGRRRQYALVGDREHYIGQEYTMEDALCWDENTRVVYQGVPGAFSEQAAVSFFGENTKKFNVPAFEDILDALEKQEADFGVLPLENSSAGFVTGSYDLLLRHDVFIAAEKIIEVEQALLGMKGAELSDIDTVYSHPQGLLQSRRFLDQYNWKQIAYDNTAMAARKIKDDGLKNQAAIASVRAAKLYGLNVLKEKINFSDTNATRFVILRKGKIYQKNAKRITISFSLPHKSGTLYNILGHFIYNNLNMTSIESCPLADSPWEYNFFVSFEGNLKEERVKSAIAAIRKEALSFKILGNY